MMRILITGSNSLLGSGLLKTAPKNFEVAISWHENPPSYRRDSYSIKVNLDVEDPKSVKIILKKITPQVVIHLASISDVDYCEINKRKAFATNVVGLRNILRESKLSGIKVIFASTNAVFDGNNAPYSETKKPNPISYYGYTKLQAEKLIQESNVLYAIVRITTMYGWQPDGARLNPVTWVIDKLKREEKIFMVTDKFINPSYNLSAAKAIWKMVQKDFQGSIHLAGKDTVSRYDWATSVAKVFDLPQNLIFPVESSHFPDLAKRPDDTSFDTKKMIKQLKIKPMSLKQGLKQMRNEKVR